MSESGRKMQAVSLHNHKRAQGELSQWQRALSDWQVEILRAGDVDCLHRIFTLRNMDVVLATYDQLKLHMDKALEVRSTHC
jgi:hypothetical protein